MLRDISLERLGDERWDLNVRASWALRESPSPPLPELRAIAADQAASVDRRLWAVYSLLICGGEAEDLASSIAEEDRSSG